MHYHVDDYWLLLWPRLSVQIFMCGIYMWCTYSCRYQEENLPVSVSIWRTSMGLFEEGGGVLAWESLPFCVLQIPICPAENSARRIGTPDKIWLEITLLCNRRHVMTMAISEKNWSLQGVSKSEANLWTFLSMFSPKVSRNLFHYGNPLKWWSCPSCKYYHK